MVRTFRGNHTIYQSCGNTHELGTASIVMGDLQRSVIGWWWLRLKGRFFNFSIIDVHSPYSGSTDDDKNAFYAQLERKYDSYPSHDVIIIGDLYAQVGQKEEFRPTIGKFSAHRLTNENGLRLIDSPPPRIWPFVAPIHLEITTSDIIDVRTYRGANIDSDHYLTHRDLNTTIS